MSILSLSNAANEHAVAIDTSAERTMNVYFSEQIAKFIELGNWLQGLIANDNSFFEESNKAIEKATFED